MNAVDALFRFGWRAVLAAWLAITMGCTVADMANTPSAPEGAQPVDDLSELDQSRSNQVRLAMVDLERRAPSGEQSELQMWTLPASSTWSAVRGHYGAQTGWAEATARPAEDEPLPPNTQVYVNKQANQRLAVLMLPARRDAESDLAVLVVQRAALVPSR
jgi:hypothetical protein